MVNPPSPEQETDNGQQETGKECPICKGLGSVRADVPVGHPDFGKLVPCTCRLTGLAERRVTALRALGDLGVMSRLTFETFNPEGHSLPPDKQANLRWAYEEARTFANNPEGWLVLKGGYGCGKTHLAAAIANACVERGQPVLFITVPDLLDHIRATFAPSSSTAYDARFEQVRTAPVLILDDLGTESSTPWAQEKLFQILNYRYNAQLPTVITTNRELEEIPMRLRSRLVDTDIARILGITALDYRGGMSMEKAHSDLSSLSLHSLKLHSHQTFENFELRKGEISPEEEQSLREALDKARAFAGDPRDWLLITGTYGCGKTHLAAAIGNHNVEQGHPTLFVVVPDLLDYLRDTFNPQSTTTFYQEFVEVRQAPLLILDDLGTESATPWAREKLYQIFDYRYNARLPTVITTAQWLEQMDPRLTTRMVDTSHCTPAPITAPAYRGGAPRRKTARRRR
jgi:DNA replication protein DnaC